jgi:hypothetical protein
MGLLSEDEKLPLAQKAYAAYGRSTGFKNYQGNPMPEWEALPVAVQTAWKKAAEEVYHLTLAMFITDNRLFSFHQQALTDAQRAKLSDKLSPGDRVKINWSGAYPYQDHGYAFSLPGFADQGNLVIHIPIPDDSDGKGNSPAAFVHLLELLQNPAVARIDVVSPYLASPKRMPLDYNGKFAFPGFQNQYSLCWLKVSRASNSVMVTALHDNPGSDVHNSVLLGMLATQICTQYHLDRKELYWINSTNAHSFASERVYQSFGEGKPVYWRTHFEVVEQENPLGITDDLESISVKEKHLVWTTNERIADQDVARVLSRFGDE